MKYKKMVGVFILGAIIFSYYKFTHSPAKISPLQPTTVQVQKVKIESIPITFQTIGTLTAAQSVKISPEIAGKIAKIYFHDGGFVKLGTPLIEFEDEIDLTKLQAAKADLNLSEKNFQRMQILSKKGVISKQEVEKAFADYMEKKSAVKELEVMVNKTKLVAPFDGMLDKMSVSEGNFVSPGETLVTLTDTHHLHVEYNIPEKYLNLLTLNQTVTIHSSIFSNQSFTGSIAFIAPTLNTQDRTVSVYAEIPNPKNILHPGMYVNVTHDFGSEKNALVIPAICLMATIDGQEVFKVVDGQVKTSQVVIGQRTENEVQILKGLSPNDEVIVAGQFKVKEGAKVKPVYS